jgi:hypothetical protein
MPFVSEVHGEQFTDHALLFARANKLFEVASPVRPDMQEPLPVLVIEAVDPIPCFELRSFHHK